MGEELHRVWESRSRQRDARVDRAGTGVHMARIGRYLWAVSKAVCITAVVVWICAAGWATESQQVQPRVVEYLPNLCASRKPGIATRPVYAGAIILHMPPASKV